MSLRALRGYPLLFLLAGALLVLTDPARLPGLITPSPVLQVPLAAGHTVGQTFVSAHSGLRAVEVFMWPGESGDGLVRLRLRADPQTEIDPSLSSGQALPSGEIGLGQVTHPGYYTFSIAPQPDSDRRYYYAALEVEGSGSVLVGADSGEAYLDGAQYLDGQPADAQTAFRLDYSRRYLALDAARTAGAWLAVAVITVFLFVLPGWALLELALPDNSLGWAEKAGLAAGVSLALYPVLLLWADLAGLHLGALYAWLPPLAGLGYLAGRRITIEPHRRQEREEKREAPSRFLSFKTARLWPDAALGLVLTLVVGVRFWVIRGLEAPMWGDSVQHTMIAQLLLDNGGLFESWQPYAPYRSLTVHYGFSVPVALYSWLTGASSAQATLLAGQIVNSLAILTLYPLAVRLTGGNRWAGVGTVLAAGLISPMPAFYVNWGRYAQLMGQAILPASLWLLWEAVETRRPASRSACLAALALAGTCLSYYRMPYLYAAFVLAWLAAWGVPRWRRDVRELWRSLGRMALAGGVALALCLPWLPRLAGGVLADSFAAGVTGTVDPNAILSDYAVWRDLTVYVPRSLLVLAVAGLIWSIWRKQWAVAAVGLWALEMALLVGARLTRLPGANLLQNYAVVIGLYIPAGLLAGAIVGRAAAAPGVWKSTSWGRYAAAVRLAGAVMLVLAAAWSASRRGSEIYPADFAMVTRPDAHAMDWIRENTPPEARFLVEGFRIYGGTSAVGSDAGWWIPLLAGRANTMPPLYAMVAEVPQEPDDTRRIVDLVAGLEVATPASAAGLRLLCDRGVTHAYIGQGQGRVSAEKFQLFSPEDVAAGPAFRLVYHQDRVYIFELTAEACA